MKNRRSKLLITLVSMAAIGLSSAALQAEGGKEQLRHGNIWGKSLEQFEISPELQEMIDQFRETREQLMKQYREIHLQFREEIAPLIAELKELEEGTPEFEAKLAEIKALREAHRDEFGMEFREARLELRQMKRQLRRQIREERNPGEG
jgi:hypothetical protein